MSETNAYGYEEEVTVTERFVPLAYDDNADHHPVAVPGDSAAPVDSANDEAINSIAATVDGALRRIAVLEEAVRDLQVKAVTQPVPVETAPVVSDPTPVVAADTSGEVPSVPTGVTTTEAPAAVTDPEALGLSGPGSFAAPTEPTI